MVRWTLWSLPLFVKADIFLQSTSQRETHPLQQYRRTNCSCVQRKGERIVASLMETSFIDTHMKFYNLMVRKVRVCNIVTCVTYFWWKVTSWPIMSNERIETYICRTRKWQYISPRWYWGFLFYITCKLFIGCNAIRFLLVFDFLVWNIFFSIKHPCWV